MDLDFIFKSASELKKDQLAQGDIIAKTEDVVERISQAHQYYADAPDYSHFVVLTQSCDLVRRRGDFKAPYITVAAAKPFKKTLEDYFRLESRNVAGSNFSYYATSLEGKAKSLIERHINNTETDFFFLPKGGHKNLREDLVVFLRLTIALRKEHYDVLASAKIAELAEVFQAKLGWLKGNIYSRVATPDLEDRGKNSAAIKGRYYEEYIPRADTVWLSSLQAQALRKIVSDKSKTIGRPLAYEEVFDIVDKEISDDVEIVSKNIVDLLIKNKLIPEGDHEMQRRFMRAIGNEPSFKSIVKAGS